MQETYEPATDDELISLAAAGRLDELRRDGRKRSPSGVWRLVVQGVDGHHLRAVRAGRAWSTSRRWVREFVQELTEAGRRHHGIPDRVADAADRKSVARELDAVLS